MMRRLVIGVGSPHGDDQIGWSVVDRWAKLASEGTRFLKVVKPLDILDLLGDIDELIVVDAIWKMPTVLVRCWEWPSEQLADTISGGSHGFGLVQALELADALRLLPKSVRIIGIAVENGAWLASLSPGSENSLDIILNEVGKHYA